MTDEPMMNQESAVDPSPAMNGAVVNNLPAEEVQTASPDMLDFSAPQDAPIPAKEGNGKDQPESIEMLMDVNLQFTVELGRTQMPVRQILELQNGSVVELDRIAGEAVDVFINEHLMARGEVVVVDDKFGVRITELISPTKRK
jgi:flagellar motor switch protein FliN/FliY